ncbi:Ig-like domain-containing protein, partial [Synechococcus sp. AH-736-G21]|nr:Ig-like domain-containing protein [Synechococcus sp. AH-736-G21]
MATLGNTGSTASERSIDWGSVNTWQSVSITITDATAPTVQSISSSTADGTYKADDVITINVDFSEAVTVNTTGGTPQLTLETGSTDQVVNYSSGSGTSTLSFTYTVQDGDSSADLNYETTSSLALNGGTIKDAAGNNATLTLPALDSGDSLAGNNAIVIDTTAPTVQSVSSSTADGTYKADDVITINVDFSEAVTVNTTGGTPQLTLETGSTDQVVNYSSGSGTSTLSFTYTVQDGDSSADLNYETTSSLALNGGTIKDAAGNNATLTLPALDSGDSLAGNNAIVIAEFSFPGFTEFGGNLVQPNQINLAEDALIQCDTLLSQGQDLTYSYSQIPPTIGILSAEGQSILDNLGTNSLGTAGYNFAETSPWDLRYVSFGGWIGGTGTKHALVGWTNNSSQTGDEGTLVGGEFRLSYGTDGYIRLYYQDVLKLTSASTFTGDQTLTLVGFDDQQQADVYIPSNWTIAPIIALEADVASLKAGETASLTFTLSEASTDFIASDVSVSGGSLSNFSGSGTSYSATFTPTADSTTDGVISVGSGVFSNSSGATNADGSDANNSVTLSVDTASPTISVAINDGGDGRLNTSEDSSVTISGSTSGAEDGQTVAINISSSSGGTPINTTATIDSNAYSVSGLDLSSLNDGTLTITADV